MISIGYLIPMPPSANRLWRIVRNKKTGKARNARSDAYERWRISTGLIIKAARHPPVRGPYELRLVASRSTGMDLGNIEKAISDLLQHLGVIENDRLAERITIEWGDYVPKDTVQVTVNPA